MSSTPATSAVGGLSGTVIWTGGRRSLGTIEDATSPFPHIAQDQIYKACINLWKSSMMGVDNSNYSSLSLFASFLQEHLENHGMDSVFYLTDKNGVEWNLIENHPCLPLKRWKTRPKHLLIPMMCRIWSDQSSFSLFHCQWSSCCMLPTTLEVV